ncbi:hypothetical protein [Rhizobium leguminosarum]|uniref:hypothetical protein n=1 Tax=Rhizobium leguminosarum TaxID=384 RepID=UPI001FE1A710|nr:hypothetical protein [Rhizobium leguminosarum]
MRDAWPKAQPTSPPSPSPFFALTVAAALSVHVPQQRQGIVMGATQSLVAITDIVTPVLAGVILGQSCMAHGSAPWWRSHWSEPSSPEACSPQSIRRRALPAADASCRVRIASVSEGVALVSRHPSAGHPAAHHAFR